MIYSKIALVLFSFQINFPAVTICNQNRISCENLEGMIERIRCDRSNTTEPECKVGSSCFENLETLYGLGCEVKKGPGGRP